jgi:hypothetical protein
MSGTRIMPDRPLNQNSPVVGEGSYEGNLTSMSEVTPIARGQQSADGPGQVQEVRLV